MATKQKIKAIARYIPMMGWHAQLESNNGELNLIMIKNYEGHYLSDGGSIEGEIINHLFIITETGNQF